MLVKTQFLILWGGFACLALSGCRSSAPPDAATAKSTPKGAKDASKTAPKGTKTQTGTTKTPPIKIADSKTLASKGPPTKAIPQKETGHLTSKASLNDFPKDIALYQGAKVLGIGKSDKGAVAGLESKDAPQKVMDFYQVQLPKQGWTINSATTTKQGGVLQSSKNKRQCIVTVGLHPKTKITTFSLTVVEK